MIDLAEVSPFCKYQALQKTTPRSKSGQGMPSFAMFLQTNDFQYIAVDFLTAL
jgi:hypothetical protein